MHCIFVYFEYPQKKINVGFRIILWPWLVLLKIAKTLGVSVFLVSSLLKWQKQYTIEFWTKKSTIYEYEKLEKETEAGKVLVLTNKIIWTLVKTVQLNYL